MPRYIDADALMREFRDFVRRSNNSDFAPVPTWNDAVSLIGVAPTANVVERKRGKWLVVSDGYGNGEATACICECSECADTIWVYKRATRKWKFCPNCGAQMEV